MRTHPRFKLDTLQSTYFNPKGEESLTACNTRWKTGIGMPLLYKHMQKHQASDIAYSEASALITGEPSKVPQRKKDELDATEALIEGPSMTPQSEYEIGLDDFIRMGTARLKSGGMQISAANYIQAIKTKADIERTQKDRKLELLKSMFSGAAPQPLPPSIPSKLPIEVGVPLPQEVNGAPRT